MESVNLSLDDIIKKNTTDKRRMKKNPNKKYNSLKSSKPVQMLDARSKIIEKNRFKIKDARDKLVNITKSMGDARLKIIKKQNMKSKYSGLQNLATKKKIKSRKSNVNGTLSLRTRKNLTTDKDEVAISLRRTVQNDLAFNMPPLPQFNQSRNSQNDWATDPFDCYVVPSTRPDPQQLQRLIRNVVVDTSTMPVKGILRSTRLSPSVQGSNNHRYEDIHNHMFNVPHNHLSNSMKARLEGAPNPYESVGIFARMPRSPTPERITSQQRHSQYNTIRPSLNKQQNHNSSEGYRIVVSNLNSMVTQNDIKELFEDIGLLLDSRIVRPGVAEVIFRSLRDAEEAVETYHNRQLDGQPMKCLLVKPRLSNKPTAPAIKPMYSDREQLKRSFTHSKGQEKAPLEIDIDALHKVLFRRN